MNKNLVIMLGDTTQGKICSKCEHQHAMELNVYMNEDHKQAITRCGCGTFYKVEINRYDTANIGKQSTFNDSHHIDNIKDDLCVICECQNKIFFPVSILDDYSNIKECSCGKVYEFTIQKISPVETKVYDDKYEYKGEEQEVFEVRAKKAIDELLELKDRAKLRRSI